MNPTPSPAPHRALRRLQSAHALGSSENRENRTNAQALPTTHNRQNTAHQTQLSQQPPHNSVQQPHKELTGASSPSQGHQTEPSSNSQKRIRSNSDASVLGGTNGGSATKDAAPGKSNGSAEIVSLDRLIRDGPARGDLTAALDTTRLKILDQGIKSDSDGMVSA
jgi:cell cycle arrest protein BUB2